MSNLHWTNITVKLGDLKPWAANPKYSTKAQAKRIKDSWENFGQVMTIAVDPELNVLDGHQRLSVLLTLHGASYEVDARQSNRPLTDEERRAMVLALTNATGSWNWDALSGWKPDELQGWGFDKDTLKGWTSDVTALKELLASEQPTQDAEPQVDRAAELLEKWQVQTGDLWQIGEHRLICGDCTDAAVVAQVMDGEMAGAVVTDPPYAFGLGSSNENNNKAGGWHDMMNNASWFTGLLRQWQELAGGGIWWMFCNWRTLPIVMRAAYDAKEGIESVLVWDKEWIGPGGSKGLRPSYELAVLFCNGDAAIKNRGVPDIYRCLWSSAKPTGHKAEKPVQLIEFLVGMTEGTVFEPFSGSGTTLVACENLERECRAMELDPKYVAVALERMATAFPELEIRRI